MVHCIYRGVTKILLANSVDPDEMPHGAAFHLGIHCLPKCTFRSKGAQWLSGRVLDSRPRGRGLEPHRRHCVVSLSKTHLSLPSTGST